MNDVLKIESINNNYRIEKELGRGGMGVVYLATDLRLERPVAIKVLNLSGLDEYSESALAEMEARFQREAKAVAKLTHPNITSIYDIGFEKNLHYMVMEFVEGLDLSKIKQKGHKLSLHRIIDISIQVCGALDFVHQRKIIHRDIKPANILLSTSGIAKLMDFGVAQLNKEGYMRLTQEGSVLGSIMYISPEQLSNASNTDNRADIYSFGVTLFEMITGRLPFEGDNVATIVMNILSQDAPLASSFNPQIPQELDRIIAKSLTKNPEDRYQTAGEMANDLKRLLNRADNSADIERQKMEEEIRRQKEELRLERERLDKQRLEEEIRRENEFLRLERERIQLEKQRLEEEKLRLERQEIERQKAELEKKKEEVSRISITDTNPGFVKPNIVHREVAPASKREAINIHTTLNITKEQISRNQETFNKAVKAIDEEDYDYAIGILRTLIDSKPNVAEYHSYLGLALYKKGWDGYAMAEFKVALHFNPADPVALKYCKNEKQNNNTINKPKPIISKLKGLFKG